MFKGISNFFSFFFLGIVAIADWLKGFEPINMWVFTFFLPKLTVVLVGLLVTSIPMWLLIIISFAPIGIVAGVFFVAFILMFAYF